MDSHEEKLHNMINISKEQAAKKEMYQKAKMLSQKRPSTDNAVSSMSSDYMSSQSYQPSIPTPSVPSYSEPEYTKYKIYLY